MTVFGAAQPRRRGLLGGRASCGACRRAAPPEPARRSARGATCWSGTSSRRARRTARAYKRPRPRPRTQDRRWAPRPAPQLEPLHHELLRPARRQQPLPPQLLDYPIFTGVVNRSRCRTVGRCRPHLRPDHASRPHHRRLPRPRRQPARRRHGPVRVPHCRARRAARRARRYRSSTKAIWSRPSRRSSRSAIPARSTSARSHASASGSTRRRSPCSKPGAFRSCSAATTAWRPDRSPPRPTSSGASRSRSG